MTRISYRFEPSAQSCATCSVEMVVRIQVSERDEGVVEERWRREECPDADLHPAAPVTAA